MNTILLEDVFCDSGVPQYTFVEPAEYIKTKVALRTSGSGVIVEGPSGIGKTTCIKKALAEIDMKATMLSARVPDDIEFIKFILQSPENLGVVIIDDFHLLDDTIKKGFSDLLKVLADTARADTKLVLIGINKAGECLIQLAPDLNNRIDTIKFEKNPEEKIEELITKGEDVLNITITCKKDIVGNSYGSFHIAQMLCKTLCIDQRITEQQRDRIEISAPIKNIIHIKMQELARIFTPTTRTFAAGNRNRRDGRALYLRLLIWLSEADDGALQMNEVSMVHPQYKYSINQIADKGYITRLIDNNANIKDVLYYDASSRILAIEDPKYMFYLKNTDWNQFAKEMGFKLENIKTLYDFALSFAGEKRVYAESLYNHLTENEYSVFYDKNQTPDILGKDLDKYFEPIYEAGATYVIVLMDAYYPKKVWTVFESKHYKDRFGENSVIPIIFNDFILSPTDPLYNKGCLTVDRGKDMEEQINEIVRILIEKMNS